jgi:hypothetical protein
MKSWFGSDSAAWTFMRTLAFLALVAATACYPSGLLRGPFGGPVLATDADAVVEAVGIVASEALWPPSAPPAPMCTGDEPDPPHTCPSAASVIPPKDPPQSQLTAKAPR